MTIGSNSAEGTTGTNKKIKSVCSNLNVLKNVIKVLKRAKEVNGASYKQIVDFIEDRLDNFNSEQKNIVRNTIKRALKDGIKKGILVENDGLFSINNLERDFNCKCFSVIPEIVSSKRRGRKKNGERRKGKNHKKVRNRNNFIKGTIGKGKSRRRMPLKDAVDKILNKVAGRRRRKAQKSGKSRRRGGNRKNKGQADNIKYARRTGVVPDYNKIFDELFNTSESHLNDSNGNLNNSTYPKSSLASDDATVSTNNNNANENNKSGLNNYLN